MFFAKKVEAIYRAQLFSRQDPIDAVYYFSGEDFSGLHEEAYPFRAQDGHLLAGRLYSYDDPIEGRVVVFDHGMGAGHRAYMREIELLARHGFLVFAYDHTGCAESEGESTRGFAQSLCDLDQCITTIKSDPRFEGFTISVVGHSWGAFSTMNIGALHPEVTHLVAISGFVSVQAMLKQNFSGLLSPFYRRILALETATNSRYVSFDARDSLMKTNARALLIHSPDDPLVKAEHHFEKLREALKDRENTVFLSIPGRAHNPNYTADAVKYKDEFFAALTKKLKDHELSSPEAAIAFRRSWDWERMTAQDMEVWGKVFDFLEG